MQLKVATFTLLCAGAANAGPLQLSPFKAAERVVNTVQEIQPQLLNDRLPQLSELRVSEQISEFNPLQNIASEISGLEGLEAPSEWRSSLPKDLDWRNFIDDDFRWDKQLPANFNWKENLSPHFPELPDEAIDWDKFAQLSFDWHGLWVNLEKGWGRPTESLSKRLPNWSLFKGLSSGVTPKNIEWGPSLKEYFTLQKVISAEFDWRNYLKPGFDLRHFVPADYDLRHFFPSHFDWRQYMPKDVDWRAHLPDHFDWHTFLVEDLGHYFPPSMDWHDVIPKDLPIDFAWDKFLVSILHWREFLPEKLNWADHIPLKQDWTQLLHKFDFPHSNVWEWIPEHFSWRHYYDEVAQNYHVATRQLHKLPSAVHLFLAKFAGLWHWLNIPSALPLTHLKGAVTELVPKEIKSYALLGSLNIDLDKFSGTPEELDVAWLKQFASSWFAKKIPAH